MEIIYIISLIVLMVAFLCYKKSNSKINLIKWIIIGLCSLLGYNMLLGMVLGLLKITASIWLLALINILLSIALLYRVVKYKELQKYSVRKTDIILVIFAMVICVVMFVKDLYIYKGDVSHMAVDSAIHYRAAKHYSENLNLFVNLEDRTFFNFNVMQPGAYINDGIFMNVISGITNIDCVYLYQFFECSILFLSGFAFLSIIIDKIKTKRGVIASLVLFALYIYGYPYNSWIFGFSYLSVGIVMIATLIPIVEAVYAEEKFKKRFIIPLIGIVAFGLIFSYCLFVPAVFSAICIYCFLKDLLIPKGEEKSYLKIFKKRTLIITGMLLTITLAGIGYLFIPTFFIEGQTNLVSALKIDGAIYSEKYKNFIVYIPFAVLYVFEIIKRIKNKSLRYQDVFSVIMIGFFACLYLGMLAGFVSPYYMLKNYFIVWMIIFVVTADMINENIDKKIFRIDAILLVLFYCFLIFAKISIESGLRIGLIISLMLYTVLPGLLKNKFNFDKLKITGTTYICIWAIFVSVWVLLKAGTVMGEEEKHSLPNLVGMYYSENCENRKLIDATQNFNKNEIEITRFVRENIEDISVENLVLSTEGYFTRIWAVATLEISSPNIGYENVVQDTNSYVLDDALNNNSIKYFIKLVSKDTQKMKDFKEELKELEDNENIEILQSNENGYVAKINR